MSERPERLLFFDGLRGVAALAVALFHFSSSSFVDGVSLVRNGWLFVDLFFVLSGFVLDRVYYLRGVSFSDYLRARAARMLPLYMLMLGLFGVFEVVRARATGSWGELGGATVVNVLALQSFGLLDRLWFYGPSWSVSAEFWVNVMVWPVVMSRVRGWALALITIGLAGLFSTTIDIHTSVDYGALRCLYGFGLGILASRLVLGLPVVTWRGLSPVTDVFALLLLFFGFGDHAFYGMMPLVFTILVVLLYWAKGSVSRRLLEGRAVVLLGGISFSLYMTHYLIGGRLMRGLGLALSRAGLPVASFGSDGEWGGMRLGTTQVDGLAYVLLYVVVCVWVAVLVKRWIEDPAYARLRGAGRPGRSADGRGGRL